MSKVVKSAAMLGLLTALAGCFLPDPNPEEVVIVEPVVVEPVTTKY
ncbi:hypothetical protein [Jannaschia aquimarina]|uniref:Lipoprotein n=1 Tax=Jannaschia aquimarina TaxID=935700 RepID=A0A0D1EGN9_9RHOB|nr:hypothetical protein [Jannaschia aquimarina]KIT16081.1 hypothetical protein jaqu_23530 [Jannaschia aquimarina]SNT01908.1 hypothetical protein SAMN05421775_104264 [Jannaschia aquimarina]